MATNSVKNAHEAFVSGFHGSSSIDIIVTVLPIVTSSIIASTFTSGKKYGLWCFITEYFFCISPLILSFTILNQVSLELNGIIIFFLLIRMVFSQQGKRKDDKINNFVKDKKLACLTSSRATVNVATLIAILAVDFHIFPRRFAKTESYGYSLMDIGAACYLFMNGITDFKKMVVTRQVLRDVLVLLVLGLLRLFSLRATNYQEHVTEYGTHCNFFFTLAFVKAACVWWTPRIPPKVRLVLCVIIAASHESALQIGLAQWTLFSEVPRSDGFLMANREWIVSLPGNVLIYLLGISTGNLIFKQYRNTSRLKVWTVIPVALFFLLFLIRVVTQWEPSRRLTNVMFVVWIVGFFLLFMTLYQVAESFSGQPTCQIFEAINSYPLLFFLLGNLLTGFVNLVINTLEVKDLVAFIIINIYMFTLCSIVYLLNTNKKRIRRE